MEKLIKPSRIIFLVLIFAAILGIYGSALYDLQIVNGEAYLEASANSIVTTATVHTSRGDILDRNGVLLVSDRTVYNLKISRSRLLNSGDPNGILLRLINTTLENGVEYSDTFPVTGAGPFSYVADMTSTQRNRLDKYFEFFKLDTDMSASDLIVWMKDHYGIDYTVSLVDARKIIGVRYELEIRVIVNTTEYTFAQNVDVDFISLLLERDFPCLSVETDTEREYHTSSAAHLLGYIGKISGTDQETYKALGYPMDALVGREGVELAFEEYLHGTEGRVTTTINAAGNVTSVLTREEAVPGSNVYLTIDIKLQEVAEEALATTIATINAGRGEDDEKAEGGAVVAVDVKSGELLVSASYPDYDPANFLANYTELANDPSEPLFNRATMGKYNPGSTFKMVTAYAGLSSGQITRYTTVEDKVKFTKYEGFQPSCWITPYSHGVLDVVGALKHSCNYFFYWLGDRIGIDVIADTARQFGFGQKTGLEVAEEEGIVASREYKKETLNEGWWAADTLISAIGQGHNQFTPVQIANYVAQIANGGTRYKLTLLDCVKSYDYSEVVYENQPEVAGVIDNSNGYISVLQQGMREVTAAGGTAASLFRNYKVPVAAKTGTVQSDTAAVNNGVFVCYAPANDPEIAIAVVVESGGSGSAIMSVAKEILDYYFTDTSEAVIVPVEDTILR